MWELMRIGLEMQERMIEVHSKGIDMAREMLDANELQSDLGLVALNMGDAMTQASKAQADVMSRWMNFWSGKS
jgi:uncharacterized protein (DUF305 family)